MSAARQPVVDLTETQGSTSLEALRVNDARLVALARAACAPRAALRRPFLRGRWRAAHVERVAAAAAALAARRGDIAADSIPQATSAFAARLRTLLAGAAPVADGLNSLAEFLGGRAASHPDRLAIVPEARAGPARADEDSSTA